MSTSVIEREPGGTPRRSTLKGTARMVTMVGVGVCVLGGGVFVSASSAHANPAPDPVSARTIQIEFNGDPAQSVSYCDLNEGSPVSYTRKSTTISEIVQRTSRNILKWEFALNPSFNSDIYPQLAGGPAAPNFSYLAVWKYGVAQTETWATIPSNGDQYRLGNSGCLSEAEEKSAAAALVLVDVCVPATGDETGPYAVRRIQTGALVSATGEPTGVAAFPGTGLYPLAGFGAIVPIIATSDYLTVEFPGTNWTPLGRQIFNANCSVVGIPTPGPTVIVPGSNTTTTVNVPGPTVTVTATPSVSPSAVAPVAVAPVAVAPVVTPSAVRPVAAAPVAAAVPTAVNAGDGSSENRPMSPVGIVLLAIAGVGVLYAALKLSTRRRSTSSQ